MYVLCIKCTQQTIKTNTKQLQEVIIAKMLGTHAIMMKLVVVFLTGILWKVSGEPNLCCDDVPWLEDHCFNQSSAWMNDMCNTYYNLSSQRFFVTDENDTLILDTEVSVARSRYCLTEFPVGNDTLAFICVPPDYTWFIVSSVMRLILNIISLACLILTIIVYVTLPYLRDVLGNCILFAVVSVTVYLLCHIIDRNLFLMTGCLQDSVLQVSRISFFFWMAVISFEIWRLINQVHIFTNKRYLLFLYVPFGWGLPLLLLGITHVVHHLPGDHIKPFYGETCWYNDSYAWLYYFFMPICSVIMIAIIMYSLTSWSLWKKARQYADYKFKSQKFKCLVCFIFFLIIVLSWILPIILATVISDSSEYFMELHDYLGALEGIFIYLTLVMFRKRVRRDLAKKRVCCICLPKKWADIPDEECVELDEDAEELISSQGATFSYNCNTGNLNTQEEQPSHS